MKIDLELYRIFCIVAKYENISKATKELYISQPAVTQRINNLEKQLNIKLFNRKSDGMKLTEEGKQLYDYVKDSIEIMNDVENKFDSYLQKNNKNNIKIKCTNLVENLYLCNAIITFSKKYPEISINLATGTQEEAIKEVLNEETDIIAVKDNALFNDKKLKKIAVQDLTPCLYTSNEYLIKQNQTIDVIHQPEDYTFILPKKDSFERIEFDNFCKKYHLMLGQKYETESVDIRNYFVLNGFGIAVGFKEYITEELKKKVFVEIPLKEKLPICHINWLIKRNKRLEKNNVQKFIEILKVI